MERHCRILFAVCDFDFTYDVLQKKFPYLEWERRGDALIHCAMNHSDIDILRRDILNWSERQKNLYSNFVFEIVDISTDDSILKILTAGATDT